MILKILCQTTIPLKISLNLFFRFPEEIDRNPTVVEYWDVEKFTEH